MIWGAMSSAGFGSPVFNQVQSLSEDHRALHTSPQLVKLYGDLIFQLGLLPAKLYQRYQYLV